VCVGHALAGCLLGQVGWFLRAWVSPRQQLNDGSAAQVGVLREERVLPAGVLVTAVGRMAMAPKGKSNVRSAKLLLVAKIITPLTKQCVPTSSHWILTIRYPLRHVRSAVRRRVVVIASRVLSRTARASRGD
jgi:hypothetical protein